MQHMPDKENLETLVSRSEFQLRHHAQDSFAIFQSMRQENQSSDWNSSTPKALHASAKQHQCARLTSFPLQIKERSCYDSKQKLGSLTKTDHQSEQVLFTRSDVIRRVLNQD